jgi:thiol:disulfide interchange protein DsbD
VFITSEWQGEVKTTPSEVEDKVQEPDEKSNEEIAKKLAEEYDLDSKISIITLDRIDENGNAIDDAGNIIDKEDLFTDAEGNITDREGNITGEIEKTTFFIAVLLIFGGGLILNLMPCVFPVLGVKVLGFVQLSGNDSKKIKMHGLVFTLGVVASMWVLAAVILIIRESSGSGVAWGSQMKNPIFVGSMVILMAMFALNLYGVFEIGNSLSGAGGKLHAKKGYQGSFFSGILTTLIATPCGAPLLATAMTYTLQQTVFLALVLFTVFALGVAAPYLVLSFFPALINKLPRPGNWMVTFKKSMAFPLLATVVFLLSAFIGQTGGDGIILMLWSLVILATAAFIYGTWSPPMVAKAKRYSIGFGLSSLLTVYGGYLGYQAMTTKPEAKQTLVANPDDIHSWDSWKPGIVDQTRAKNRIVWIDYTADW